MSRTPASLLERLRRPDPGDAWRRFVDLYTPMIYSWAGRMGLQESDAADLVQDVFTLLLRKMPEFHYDRCRSFRGWLRKLTLNRWRETCRQAGPRPAGDAALADVAGPDPAEALWEAEYQQQVVARALHLMRTDFQQASWQACWELVVQGRPAAEVADELGLSVGAVHAAKFRVLSRLRQELAGLLD